MSLKKIILSTLLTASFMATAQAASTNAASANYKVTITNLTRGQVFSPPVLGTHKKSFHLFQVGQSASMGLAQIAEDGHTAELAKELETSGVSENVVIGAGPIMPGASQSYELTGSADAVLSFASMLATTNDGFAGVDATALPRNKVSFYIPAYDSGTEANTESCQHVPAPPCNAHDVRATEEAEGFIHVHAGIQGVADLAKERFDWRNPVALVVIEKQ